MKLCSHEGCGGKYYARGMCVKHYSKWFRSVEVKPKKPNARELVLQALPGTSADLKQKTELCICAVRTAIRGLRSDKKVYVRGWKDGSAIYARGDRPDVPRPCMTSAEYSRRYRESNPDRLAQRRQMYAAITRAKAKPNTWASALGVRQ